MILTVSCGSAHHEELIGQYSLFAADIPEQMSVTDKNGGYVVAPTVYEVGWNHRFIVVKQHPRDKLNEVLHNNFSMAAFDSLKQNNIEGDLHSMADSIASAKVLLASDEIAQIDKDKLTLYHLIDTRLNKSYSSVFLSKSELNNELERLKVGKLDKQRRFEHLEKK